MNALSRFYSRRSDAKFFTTTKKGEMFELRAELNSEKKSKKKDAVKRVIANMTVGKDVSPLFADVLKCMQTDDLELKKLVYLYLMIYSKSQPDLVILAVNSFVKDSEDQNPLLRALSIRTMGCINVDQIIDYLREPLRKSLRDSDPYVRKTAAICVTKLFALNPTLVQESDILQLLHNLVSDPNPAVVVNAVTALVEIYESKYMSQSSHVFEIEADVITGMLVVMNECNEWGQIVLLDTICSHASNISPTEAEHIIERVVPRMQHANASVVLSAIKVVTKYVYQLQDSDMRDQTLRKLGPPLVSLLSAESEVQYIALRNILLLLENNSDILKDELRMFFCKYNDSPAVKVEKLNILIHLVTDKNVEQVLAELKEYATEVDVDFVRRSIRAIGKCAIKTDRSGDRCVQILLDLISSKVVYVVQEGILVMRDIFRKYPGKYEGVLPTICGHLENLQEAESKAALIWIIGEYTDRIENAYDLLDYFVKGFRDEEIQVQLQLLTSIVKLFLRRPASTQVLVQHVLALATEGGQLPDLRDRGFIYWRLLSGSPAAAVSTVLADRPVIAIENDAPDPTLVETLVKELGSVASVLHRLPESFIISQDIDTLHGKDLPKSAHPDGIDSGNITKAINLLELDDSSVPESTILQQTKFEGQQELADFFSDDNGNHSNSGAPDASAKGVAVSSFPTKKLMYEDERIKLHGSFRKDADLWYFDVLITNVLGDSVPLSDFAIQFNKNSFGLVSKALVTEIPDELVTSFEVCWLLDFGGTKQKMVPLNLVQMALRMHAQSIIYFATTIPFSILLAHTAPMAEAPFWQVWNSLPDATEYKIHSNARELDIQKVLGSIEIMLVTEASSSLEYVGYYHARTVNGIVILLEVTSVKASVPATFHLAAKTKILEILPYLLESLQQIFQNELL